MRKGFRKMIVDQIEYQWKFRYDDYDYCKEPYLLILPVKYEKAEIRVVFSMGQDHFLLNSGFPATLNGQVTVINLNLPKLVADIISYCILEGVNYSEKKAWLFDGASILTNLGYRWKYDDL